MTSNMQVARLLAERRRRRRRPDAMRDVVAARDALAERFAHGHPSNVPDETGVFIHVWDVLEDPQAPWLPCLRPECKQFSRGRLDRLPSSLIYRNMPNRGKNESIPMFADGLRGGLLLRPTSAQVRCAYPSDGHSRWNSDGCACPFLPDVAKGKRRADDCSRWCDDPVATAKEPNARGVNLDVKELRCGGRPWRPATLQDMLTRAQRVGMDQRGPWGGLGRDSWTGSENNEVVVSASQWNASASAQHADRNASAPSLVAAFWYPVSRTGPCCNYETPVRCAPRCGERERQVRQAFLAAHNLGEHEGPPLIELRRHRWRDPFHLVAPAPRAAAGGGAGPTAATGHGKKARLQQMDGRRRR